MEEPGQEHTDSCRDTRGEGATATRLLLLLRVICFPAIPGLSSTTDTAEEEEEEERVWAEEGAGVHLTRMRVSITNTPITMEEEEERFFLLLLLRMAVAAAVWSRREEATATGLEGQEEEEEEREDTAKFTSEDVEGGGNARRKTPIRFLGWQCERSHV